MERNKAMKGHNYAGKEKLFNPSFLCDEVIHIPFAGGM